MGKAESAVTSQVLERTARVPGAVRGLFGSWRNRIVVIAVTGALVVGAIVAQRAITAPGPLPQRTAQVSRGAIAQTVAMSGTVGAASQIRLSFKSPGKIAQIQVAVGQQVDAGQALATLDTADLGIVVAQAQANLSIAQARYDQTVAGASAEDIAIARQAVENAKRSFDETQRTVQNDLATAQQTLGKLEAAYGAAKTNFTSVGIAIPNDVASLATSVTALKTQSSATATDIDKATHQTADVVSARNAILQAAAAVATAQSFLSGSTQAALNDYIAARDGVNDVVARFDFAIRSGRDTTALSQEQQVVQATYASASSRLATALDAPAGQLQAAQTAVALAQISLSNGSTRSSPALDPARDDVVNLQNALGAAEQTVGAAKSALAQATAAALTMSDVISGSYASARQSVQSIEERSNSSVINAQNTLAAAQVSLAKTSGAPKSYDIAATYATVISAQAALQKAQSDLDNATLRSPTAGVVAQVNNQVGESVTGTSTVPSILLANVSSYVLRGTVGEADVTKLRLGQTAVVVVDAVGAPTSLTGRISAIDPLATPPLGGPLYGIELTLDAAAVQVRSGMSGTANIVASRQGVLAVPSSAVHREAGRPYVQILRDGKTIDTAVTLGIANANTVEVISGTSEGDTVVLPAARTATSSSGTSFGLGGDQPVILRPSAPFAYPSTPNISLERIAIVVTVANRSADDLQVSPADFVARDAERQLYPANLAAAATDARAVALAAKPLGISGIVPLTSITLRKDDVVSGFVVFDVPTGVRPVELIFRQSDTDRVA